MLCSIHNLLILKVIRVGLNSGLVGRCGNSVGLFLSLFLFLSLSLFLFLSLSFFLLSLSLFFLLSLSLFFFLSLSFFLLLSLLLRVVAVGVTVRVAVAAEVSLHDVLGRGGSRLLLLTLTVRVTVATKVSLHNVLSRGGSGLLFLTLTLTLRFFCSLALSLAIITLAVDGFVVRVS